MILLLIANAICDLTRIQIYIHDGYFFFFTNVATIYKHTHGRRTVSWQAQTIRTYYRTKTERYKHTLLGCYPDCTTWQLTAEQPYIADAGPSAQRYSWRTTSAHPSLHLFDAQTAQCDPSHSSAEKLNNGYESGKSASFFFVFFFSFIPTLGISS